MVQVKSVSYTHLDVYKRQRVDRFDANQKVLKDPFLFYEAHTLREVRQLQPEWDHPGNMGDDFVVYVDDIRNPSKPIGYRSGYTWYNAQGIEISDPTLLRTASGIAPYLVNPNLTHPTSAAFKDYDPQITVMPRIAFSFPISEEALFLAHYDIITKRPTEGLRLDPTNYYFAQTRGGSIFSNPALKPEKTIDYEVGFQQMIGEFSAIKLSTSVSYTHLDVYKRQPVDDHCSFPHIYQYPNILAKEVDL